MIRIIVRAPAFWLAILSWAVLGASRAAVVAAASQGGALHVAWLWPVWWLTGLCALAGALVVALGLAAQAWYLRGRDLPGGMEKAASLWLPSFALLALVLLESGAGLGYLPEVLLALGREAWPLLAAAVLLLVAFQTRTLAPDQPKEPGRIWRLAPWLLAAISLAASAVMGYGISRLNQQGFVMAGDEPQYLFAAHSIAVDHDLDLWDQIMLRENAQFMPPDAAIGGHGRWTGQRVWLSKHMPGLALLIAPAYAWALELGLGVRSLAALVIWLMAAWLTVELYLLARALTGRPGPSFIAAASLCLLLPVWHFSCLIFPEVPAAALTMAAFRRISQAGARPRPWGGLWLAGIAGAFLPWLNERFILICALLTLFFVARGLWRNRRDLLFFALPLVISGLGLAAYFWLHYGHPWPPLGVHAAGQYLNPKGPWPGMLGILLDAGEGLFVYAPIWLAGLAGLGWLLRKKFAEGLFAGLIFAAAYVLAGLYAEWYGGLTPAGRYLVAAVPLLALGLAAGLAWGGWWLWALAGVFGLASLGADVAVWERLRAFYGSVSGHEPLLQWGMAWPLLTGSLPKFLGQAKPYGLNVVQGLIWAWSGIILVILMQRGARRGRPGRALAGLLIGMLVLMGAAGWSAHLGAPLSAQAGMHQRLTLWQRMARLKSPAGAPPRAMVMRLPVERFAHPPAKPLPGALGGALLPAGDPGRALVWGQYLDLPAGRYELRAGFAVPGPKAHVWLDASADWGKVALGRKVAGGPGWKGSVALSFTTKKSLRGFEARCGNAGPVPLRMMKMDLMRLQSRISGAP